MVFGSDTSSFRSAYPAFVGYSNQSQFDVQTVLEAASHTQSCFIFLFGPFCGISDLGPNPSCLHDFVRWRNDLTHAVQGTELIFCWFFAADAYISSSRRDTITHITGSPPTLIHAGDFVHVSLALYVRGVGELGGKASWTLPDLEFFTIGTLCTKTHVLRWTGAPHPLERPDGISPNSYDCLSRPSIEITEWCPTYTRSHQSKC